MNYEQMSNNKLQLTGTVTQEPVFTHSVYGEGFYETALSIPRLSGQTDVIPITFSDRLADPQDVQVGQRISVAGQFRSYNKQEGTRSRLLLTAFVREMDEADDTRNPNMISIVGYICKPPVYRTTPFQREICDVLIAVNRAYNKSDYIPCILWGRNARYVCSMPVGEKIELVGRIQSRMYTKTLADGSTQERVAYEVSVSKIVECEKQENHGQNYSKLSQLL